MMARPDVLVAVASSASRGRRFPCTCRICFAFGQEQGDAGADVLAEREQAELLAEDAVVALFGLFQPDVIGVQFLLRVEQDAVDALELGRFSSPRQYAPAVWSSLKTPIWPVLSTCGPRHRSVNGPCV